MLKVRYFQGDTVMDLEQQLNTFLEGLEVTHASQILSFQTSGLAGTSKAGHQALLAVLMYDVTPTTGQEGQKALTDEQKALPQPH